MSYNPICAKCPFELRDRKCFNSNGKSPANCPTEEFADEKSDIIDEYKTEELKKFYITSSDLSGGMKTRIEETVEVADKMGYKRLGLAFCSGLRNEAKKISGFLEKKGFEVCSVICKCGNIAKSEIDETAEGRDAKKTYCNPLQQAMVLNKAETDWNIVVGLCVGHDSILLKHCDAMCTVLAAKDKVTGHNPLAPVYTLDSYYRGLKK